MNGSYLKGNILCALPQLKDIFFSKSIIYITHHNKDGAVGIVLNYKIMSIRGDELFKKLKMFDAKHNLDKDFSFHIGGPLNQNNGFILHSQDYKSENTLNVSMLFSGYKSVMESPEAKATIQNALARPEDYDTVLEVYKNTPYPKGVWSVTWAPIFNSWLKETMFEFLMEDKSVEDTIDAINNKINELNEEYGIG